MTANEKQALAGFLDTAADFLGSGYGAKREPYRFEDDPPAAAPQAAPPSQSPAPSSPLEAVAAEVAACAACGLAETRKRAVPGEGCGRPLVMVVGEGPGADEDASGRPFVGRAGQLLDKMLAAIGLSRERNCFIANVVKCRPPGNRDPKPEEAAACRPFLHRQIAALSPGFLLAVGRVAAHNLLGSEEALGRLRGRFLPFTQDGGSAAIPLLVTYHPSALLRDESLKRPAFDDLKLLMSRLLAHDEGYRTEAAALAAKYGVSAREG